MSNETGVKPDSIEIITEKSHHCPECDNKSFIPMWVERYDSILRCWLSKCPLCGEEEEV